MNIPQRRKPPRLNTLVIANYDPSTGSYRVEGPDGYASMSFSHPWIAARVGIVIAGELGDRDREDCAH